MSTAESDLRAAIVSRRLWPALIGYAGLAAVVAWWGWRALHDSTPWDTGLAYAAGQVAWATGHPEHVGSWISTPFLGAVMACLSRVLSVRAVADLVNALNIALWVGAVALALQRTRRLLPATWWWIAAFALMSFAPLMSSVWWKQFNVIALVLAILGFELVRRRQIGWGAAAIGLSISIKPLLLLLPLVMFARRGTRRAGTLAIAWVVGLNVAAQGFMALRAHDLATLDPLIEVRNFLDKTRPNPTTCLPFNFSPASLLCRSVGSTQDWTLQRVAVLCALFVLGAFVVDALRGRDATSWEVFAFTAALSVMLSTLEWTHYQIVLAPLFFLLLYRFAREGAGLSEWLGLAVAFALASLIWQPYGSVVSAINGIVSPRPWHEPIVLEGLAQYAQYVLLLTGAFWYARRGPLRQGIWSERQAGASAPASVANRDRASSTIASRARADTLHAHQASHSPAEGALPAEDARFRTGKHVVVVMPAFNAAETLERTWRQIPRDWVDQIILVDDGSRDETSRIARSLSLELIRHHHNVGYGGNQKTCYTAALREKADVVVMLHPDGQYDPTLLPDLVRPILRGEADMVLGSRFLDPGGARRGGMPLYKYMSNRFLTTIENTVLRSHFSELHTGYRAYSHQFLEAIPYLRNSDDFAFDTEVIAQAVAWEMRIREVPVATRYFPEASSATFHQSLVYGVKTLLTMLRFALHRNGLVRSRLFRQ